METAVNNVASHTEFTPGDLLNFPFSGYRVVVLNWDDAGVVDFASDVDNGNLESYIENGGVVWVQAAIQGLDGDSFAMPFGGDGIRLDGVATNAVVDPGHALVAGAPDPLTGTWASHAHFTDLPPGAHVITREGDASGPATLYTLRACPEGTYQPDGRIRKGSGAYVGNNVFNDDGSGQARTGSAPRGDKITFSVSIQNEGQFADRFTLRAKGPATSEYTVTYWRGTTNITSAVVSGTYKTPSLAPGDSVVIKAKVKVKASATNGSSVTRLVTIRSVAEPRRLDAVTFTGARS